MKIYTRRDLIKGALMGGAGAAVLRPFSVGTDAASASSAQPEFADEYDPGFVNGRVTRAGGDGVLTVVDPDDQLQQLKIGPLTQTWKAARWNSDPVSADDCVYARGERTEERSSQR